MSDLTPDERAAIEARHVESTTFPPGRCIRCNVPWPCDAARLIAALTAAEARALPSVERLAQALSPIVESFCNRPQGWTQAAVAALVAALLRLPADDGGQQP